MLSKVDRLRHRVKKSEAELARWREWAAQLLGRDECPPDTDAMLAIRTVWDGFRGEVEAASTSRGWDDEG